MVLSERHARALTVPARVDSSLGDVQREVFEPPQQRGQELGKESRRMLVSWPALDWLGEKHGWWGPGEALERMRQLRTDFVATNPSSQEASGTQGASGAYAELGNCCQTGGGRRSFVANGHACRTPFSGKEQERDDFVEPALSGLTGVIAGALQEWWPEAYAAMQVDSLGSQTAGAFSDATQYPSA